MIEVSGLEVRAASGSTIVEEINFSVGRGQIVGLAGESGSGKTTTGLALLGWARQGARITGGSARVNGTDLLDLPPGERARLRGSLIAYVPQEPGQALNPSLRVGRQVREILRAHAPDRCTPEEIGAVLKRVGLPGDHAFQRRFPHQLSGGQQQRVAIAVALAARPLAVVFDEPTTGLDVVTQALILEEIRTMRTSLDLSAVYISHDLAVISTIADRLIVMYSGLVVEDGPAAQVLSAPRHPYTHGLLGSVPDHAEPHRLTDIPGLAPPIDERAEGCPFAPRCSQAIDACSRTRPSLEQVESGYRVRCILWARTPPVTFEPPVERLISDSQPLLVAEGLRAEYRLRQGTVIAVDSVSFTVKHGQSLALVGESGSGKTTIGRCIAGLHAPSDGKLLFDGRQLAPRARDRQRELRRRIQIVFQNPYDSLSPRQSIAYQIARPAILLRQVTRDAARREVETLLEQVRLPRHLAHRYPTELSGGERQRVAIARALAAHPDLMVCDEITSALDVSVQAAVLDLLADLRRELGLTVLFISHDLGVVATIADDVIVLHAGRIRETGPARGLIQDPKDGYTRTLLDSVPRLPDHTALQANTSAEL
jgi:peptide/nickel transport system ATP-binding protein